MHPGELIISGELNSAMFAAFSLSVGLCPTNLGDRCQWKERGNAINVAKCLYGEQVEDSLHG